MAQADVHRPGALGQDHIHAAAAAVGVAVVPLEGVGLPDGIVGIGAAGQVGVAVFSPVEVVVAEAAVQHVGADATAQGVVAPAAVQQVGAAEAVHHVIAAAGEHLLRLAVAGDRLAVVAAEREAAVGEKIVHPAGDVAERLVGVAVLVEEVVAADFEAVVKDAVGDGVHQVLAEELGGGAIVLDLVEAGLGAILVIAVVEHEGRIAVGAHPAVDRPQVVAADPAVEIDIGGGYRLEKNAVEGVGGGQAVVDVQGGRLLGKAGIQPDPIHQAIETAAGGGGIAVVIGDPFGHIADAGIGVAVLVLETPVGVDREADVIDAVIDGVDGVLAEQLGGGAVVLHQVVAGFDAVLVVAMALHEEGVARRVTLDPAIDPGHFRGAEAGVVPIGAPPFVEGGDARLDQLVEVVGGLGAAGDLNRGDGGLQAGVRHDRFHDAIEVAAAGGQIPLEEREPAGHIGEGGVVVAVLVGEAGAVGAERKTDVIDAVEHRVDQGAAVEAAVAAIALDGVKAGLRAVLIVAVQRQKELQALRVVLVAEPGVEGHDVGGQQHPLVEGVDRPQALGDQTVQPVRRGDAATDRTRLVGAGQAGIAGDPAEGLIQAAVAAAHGLREVGGVAGDGGHGRRGKGTGEPGGNLRWRPP